MEQVKVLMIGAAFSADLHMDGYSRCTDIAKIVAVCDKVTERAEELLKRYNIKKTKDNIEAIIKITFFFKHNPKPIIAK